MRSPNQLTHSPLVHTQTVLCSALFKFKLDESGLQDSAKFFEKMQFNPLCTGRLFYIYM